MATMVMDMINTSGVHLIPGFLVLFMIFFSHSNRARHEKVKADVSRHMKERR